MIFCDSFTLSMVVRLERRVRVSLVGMEYLIL